MISSTQNEEMSSGNDEMEAEVDVEAIQELADANMIFARIAKISQGLRKFRKDCENFARIAKISQP